MRIFIPTCRAEQVTYNNLPESLHARVEFVVTPKESQSLKVGGKLLIAQTGSRIAEKRQLILDNCDEPFVMLDDDLRFATRRDDDPTKFFPSTTADIERLFRDIEGALNQYAHVGVSGREGANRNIDSAYENNRMLRILGYQPHVLKACNIRFDDMDVMEDFYVTLKLLTRGYPNIILNHVVHDQVGSNKNGGCAQWRTPEVQSRAAYDLASRFPQFVTVVKKSTKTAWGGGERDDVRIQWKKAFEFGDRHSAVLDQREGKGTGP